MILCADPRAQYEAHKREIDAAIAAVCGGGRYILGDETKAFEAEFAAYNGAVHAIGVANGTDAIVLALKACGVGPGDEVITVSHTAVATVAAIELAGASPVLVDILPDTFTMDVEQVEKALSPRTKAIIVVHLYGHPADLQPILALARARGVRVIEDCAQAHGAIYQGRRVGGIGDMGCYSFYPTKNLGALGDGGAVVTSDPALAERTRLLREYGWAERYISRIAGGNSRLDELQSAVLRIKLRNLTESNASRRRLASQYDRLLQGCGVALPQAAGGVEHVYHLYVIRSGYRDALQQHLKDASVGALVHYPMPVHRQPAYANRVKLVGGMTETDRASREVLSLPMYPQLKPAEVEQVAAAIRAFTAKKP